MKKKTRLLSLILVLCLLVVSGCAGGQKQEKKGSVSVQSAAESEVKVQETAYPVTILDQAGREVTLEKKPEKIVSAYYISTSILMSLGLEKHLAGIEAKAASRPIYAKAAPELLKLPNVGTAKEFNLEACIALKPDLVVIPAKLSGQVEALEQAGLKVIVIKPESQELLENAVSILGTATGTSDAADRWKAEEESALGDLKKSLEGSTMPRVYMAGNGNFLTTAGKNMYQNTLISQAGGKNVAEDLEDRYWAQVSYEQIQAWNPEVIILAAEATYSVDSVLQDPALAGVDAVQNRQVYQMPNEIEAWDSPIPSGFLGSIWAGSILHGDRIKPETYETLKNKFYQEFYGFTPEKQ